MPYYRRTRDREQRLQRRSLYFEFAVHYLAQHPESADAGDVRVTGATLDEFRDFVREKKVEHTDDEWEESREFNTMIIRAEILGALHGLEARQRVIIEQDLQVLKALEVLPAAERMPIVALELDGLKPESTGPGDEDRKARGPETEERR